MLHSPLTFFFYVHDRLTIHINFNTVGFLSEKSHRKLIKTGRNQHQNRFILFPQEVLRTSIDALGLPRDLARTMQLPRFPDPPRCAILSTQSLLHKCVIIKHLLHLWVTHTLLNFLLDYLQRPIHILQGHFLIQKLAQVLDRALKQKFLLGVLNLADQDFLHELQLLLCHSLLRVIDSLTVVLPHTLKIFT